MCLFIKLESSFSLWQVSIIVECDDTTAFVVFNVWIPHLINLNYALSHVTCVGRLIHNSIDNSYKDKNFTDKRNCMKHLFKFHLVSWCRNFVETQFPLSFLEISTPRNKVNLQYLKQRIWRNDALVILQKYFARRTLLILT